MFCAGRLLLRLPVSKRALMPLRNCWVWAPGEVSTFEPRQMPVFSAAMASPTELAPQLPTLGQRMP